MFAITGIQCRFDTEYLPVRSDGSNRTSRRCSRLLGAGHSGPLFWQAMPERARHSISLREGCLARCHRSASGQSSSSLATHLRGGLSEGSEGHLPPEKWRISSARPFSQDSNIHRKSLIINRASDGIRTRDLSIKNQEELKPFRLAMNRGQLGDTVGSSIFAMEIGIVRAKPR
jgi:hypothetical protein